MFEVGALARRCWHAHPQAIPPVAVIALMARLLPRLADVDRLPCRIIEFGLRPGRVVALGKAPSFGNVESLSCGRQPDERQEYGEDLAVREGRSKEHFRNRRAPAVPRKGVRNGP